MDLSGSSLLPRGGITAGVHPSAGLSAPPLQSQAAWPSVAVLLMSRVRQSSVPWALGRLVRGSGPLRQVPGLRFARVLGSGRRGGFGLRPGLDCQGVFALFDGLQDALHFAHESSVAASYRARAEESFSAVLLATSAKGSWAGQGMAAGAAPPDPRWPGSLGFLGSINTPGLPVAALTRAAIRPRHLLHFWRHAPAAERDLAQAPGCQLAVGLGEAPLLRQATFSLWDSTAALDNYARHGAHQRAIHAALGGRYFSESLFVRFVPLALQGRWQGRDVDGLAGG